MQLPMPDDAALRTALRQPALRAMRDADALINVYRVMCWAPEAAAAVAQLGATLFTAASLAPADRELAILACAATFRSAYEADQHLLLSRLVGITDEQRAAVADGSWQDPCFTDHQRELLSYVRAVAEHGTVGRPAGVSLRAGFTDRELVEIAIVVGAYFLVARMTTVFEVPSDPPADQRLLALAHHQVDDRAPSGPVERPDEREGAGAGAGRHASARQVVERLLSGLAEGPTPALAELYAEDAVVDLPFARPGGLRLTGRDQLGEHFARAARAPFRLVPARVTLHETRDPEVVVAEYDHEGEVLGTGRTFTVTNVQVVRVRDGLVVASRDFHDHAALARAVGGDPPTPR